MLTLMVECWAENVALEYDPDTRTTHNIAGVETRIPGFGNTTTVEWIDKSMRDFSIYFAVVVSKLLPQVTIESHFLSDRAPSASSLS